jgi:CDP-glycerol glycerophosphotransferase (TagB/SpsB family)
MSAKPRVLYAPTWEGYFEDSCYSSVLKMGERLIETIQAVSDRYTFDFKPHPLTGRSDARYREAQAKLEEAFRALGDNWVAEPNKTLYEYFERSDVLVTDISSVVSDYLFLGRPIILSNPLAIHPMIEQFPVAGACYVLEREPFALESLLSDALGPDSKKAERLKMRTHTLGPFDLNPLEAFRKAVTTLASEPNPARNKIRDEVSNDDFRDVVGQLLRPKPSAS